MQYKQVINDLNSALRFVKPLAKVLEHLEFLNTLEEKTRVSEAKVSASENTERVAREQAEEAGRALIARKESASDEIRKINDTISKAKDETIKDYENRIEAKKAEYDTIEKQRLAVQQDISGLGKERNALKEEVAKLKAALKSTAAAVGGV
ncbi:MAG: hypothetical protein GY928_04945 [Colwellia sp.]|nr:hypothetical protein [Colwellia sp.]